MKFCLLFNLSPCAGYCLLIGSQLTTWSQGNLHYIGLHFFQLDREFFCLLPSLTRLYSAAASPSERLRSDGSLAISSFLSRSSPLTTVTYGINLLLSCYVIGTLFHGCLVLQFWQGSVSWASIFAILTGKYGKRV